MSIAVKSIRAEDLIAATDTVLGIDPSQAPTSPTELNERLTVPQPGVTDAFVLLMSQQKTKALARGLPWAYTLLEAAQRGFPEEMKEAIKSKSFITSIATVAGEARAAALGEGIFGGALRERQPALVEFLEKSLAQPGGWAQKLSQDDRIGLYALVFGTIRAIERQLTGVEQPARAAKEPGRNEPCFCGSGKKYKKCHGSGAVQDEPKAS